MFRNLRADEIELRVGTCSAKGFSLLLYKDARCDMNILDETVGEMNWKKSYQLIDGQLFCTIEIWDKEKGEWIGKQDVGTESNTEAEKGRASDAQKRSAVCFGIGRELYSSPFIWIKGHTEKNDKGKYVPEDNMDRYLYVSDIGYDENRVINRLVIKDKSNKAVYSFKAGQPTTDVEVPTLEESPSVSEMDRPRLIAEVSELIGSMKLSTSKVYAKAGVSNLNEINTSRLPNMIAWLHGLDDKKRKELM